MKSVDKYVYPDTNILINKFDCRDEDKLREIEALSTGGNNDGFVSIFGRNIIPIDEYKEYQSRLTSTLLILSKDDI